MEYLAMEISASGQRIDDGYFLNRADTFLIK